MKSKAIRIINSFMLLISAIFIVLFFYSKQKDLKIIFEKPINSLYIIVFVLINCLCILLVIILWKTLLGYFSKFKLTFSEIADFYVRSNINKYLPGNVGHYIARNFYANKLGIDIIQLNLCSILEIAFVLITAVIILLFLSFNELIYFLKEYFSYIIILPIIFVVICIFLAMSTKVRTLFVMHIKPLLNIKMLKIFIVQFIIFTCAYLIHSAILSLILNVYLGYTISYYNYLKITMFFILSWFIGFITPGAPGGIGVREAILTISLSSICTVEDAITASVILRLIDILTDVFAYIIFMTKNKIKT